MLVYSHLQTLFGRFDQWYLKYELDNLIDM